MRLLIEEPVPERLRRHLPSHDVRTVVEMGWSGVKNGALLALDARGFGIFVTVDKGVPADRSQAAIRPRAPVR